MTDRIDVNVTGLAQAQEGLRQITSRDVLAKAWPEISEAAAGFARMAVPVRSGKLRGSIKASKSKLRAGVSLGKKAVPYAHPIVWGWPAHHIAPSGMRERVDTQIRPEAARILDRHLSDAVRSI